VISGVEWPLEGWVTAELPLSQCERGVHVCRPEQLALWLHEELWEVELDGQVQDGLDCVIAERARLVRPIDAWQAKGPAFVAACHAHATAQLVGADEAARAAGTPFVDDALAFVELPQVAAYCAAYGVAHLEGEAKAEEHYRRERSWQSRWLIEQLLT
jgi:hypothetical protein